MFTIDVANTIFVVCLAVGGVLLLVTVLLDDILGGVLDSIGLDFELGEVSRRLWERAGPRISPDHGSMTIGQLLDRFAT